MITHSNYRPEEKLLILCARAHIHFEELERARNLLRQRIDWNYFLNITLHHRLLPLIYQNFRSYFSELVSKPVLAEIHEYYQTQARNSLFKTKELIELLELFQKEEISAIPYKGPIFAVMVYGDLTLRKFSNLDIFICKKDILKAKKILNQQGYSYAFPLTQKQQEYLLKIDCKLIFKRNRSCIHLHWETDQRAFSFSRSDSDKSLWQNLETTFLGDRKIQTFSAENLVLIFCFHASKHAWNKLGLVCDLSEIIQKYTNLDWMWILQKAHELGGERMLFLGLSLAKDIYESALPKTVLEKIATDTRVNQLTFKIQKRFFKKRHALSKLENTYLYFQTLTHIKDKIHLSLKSITPPILERILFPHPKTLYLFYYLTYPIRFIINSIQKLKHPSIKLDLATYVPTPFTVIKKMLDLAQVGPHDTVYDLGCGDGRMVIMAAKECKARGIGIDLDPTRISEANQLAHQEGVEHLVKFLNQDAKTVDISTASIIMLYLPSSAYLKLKPLLKSQLRPGTKIVTRTLFMEDFPLIKTEIFKEKIGTTHTFYLHHV